MSTRKIEKKDWNDYFDRFSRRYLTDDQPEYAGILILSMDSGAQPETSWLPLEGITYDPKNNVLEIRVEKLDHFIWEPTEIYIDEMEDGQLAAIEIRRKDGITEIIEIR